MRPKKRLIFIINNEKTYRFDITSDGDIILLTPPNLPININLNGIRYSIKEKQPLSLTNEWKSSGHSYQSPSLSTQGSVVYLSGIIKDGLLNHSFAQLPIGYRPSKKEIFYIGGLHPSNQTTGGSLARVEVLPTGECLIYNLTNDHKRIWYSLEGLNFITSDFSCVDLKLSPNCQIYEKPTVFHENGYIQLRGITQVNSNLIAQLPKNLAPNQRLFFYCPNFSPTSTYTRILIDENGNISKIQGPHSAIICLGNISYLKPNINYGENKFQMGGFNDATTNTITIGNLNGFQQSTVDGAQNIQFIDLQSSISQKGKITQWQIDAGRTGDVLLQVYRPVTVDRNTGNGNYRLVGEYSSSVQQLGLNQISIPVNFQIDVQVGDYIGWRYPGLGIIKFKQQSGNVRWLYGNSPGINQLVSFTVGEARSYAYLVTIQTIDQTQKIGDCEIINNFDYPGNDISSAPSKTVEECAMRCQQTPGCNGFARANSNGNCWLKSKMENKSPNNDRTSGFCISQPLPKQIGNCEIIPGFDFPGNDINNSQTATLQDCANLCQKNPNCKGFSRLDGSGQCWIKTTMANKTQYPGLTSGICNKPEIQAVNKPINQNEIGGSATNPARSAQHIVDEYTKKGLNYPVDGTYWIRVFDYLQPQQVYCNFSIRKGYGYMLVGSVTNQINWLPVNSQALPMNPYLNYGTYQTDGKMGNYYRAWNDLDLNTILDQEPGKCQSFGYQYNTENKFCGNKTDEGIQRLNFNGGISEFLFVTGNGKYWIVLPRNEVPGQVQKEVWKKAKLIASSQNFEGSCDPNNSVFILSRPNNLEDPWINAGDAHKCGNNYMFWGLNNYPNHQNFKNNNGGVQFYIGGPITNTQPQSFPHNPTHHVAPNKNTYQSTYAEALSVCSTMGKKVCSKDELTAANKAGYSSCACGWTETKVGDQYWVGYPTNMDQWITLNRGAEKNVQGGWCGVPGMNQCGLAAPDKGIWGNPGADIYCCDRFDFSSNFDLLDGDYIKAKVWVSEIETLFNNMYGQLIPSPLDILVYGQEGLGVSVSKRGQSYDLINSEQGKAPQKLPSIRCQLPMLTPAGTDRRAIFLNDIRQLNIIKGEIWPINTGKLLTITFGSQIRLNNTLNNALLSTQEVNYYHPGSSKKTQVMGTQSEDNSSLWLIKTQRGSGNIDNRGFGDEKYNFGQPISNGTIIRLESVSSGKNLHSNSIHKSPSGKQEVYLNEQGKLGDSNDHWRVEILEGTNWTINSQFRLVHVNTNNVLYSDSTTYQPSPNSNIRYIEVSANNFRGQGDTWKIHSYILGEPIVDVCHELTENIKKLNLQIRSINQQKPTNGSKLDQQLKDLLKEKQKLVEQYNIECRKMSVYEYKNQMNQQEQEIKKIMDQYDQERKKLEQIDSQWNTVSQQQNNLDQQYQISEKEYQYLLRTRCLPVTGCLPPVGNNLVPSQCQQILDQLDQSKGVITDQISGQIKNILVGSDDVGKYDIRNHPDFYKLIENSKIQPCPKK